MIEIKHDRNLPKPKNKKGLIIAIIIVVLVLVSMIVSFATNANTDNNTPQPTTPTTPQTAISNIEIGETFELEGIKITVKSFEFRYYAYSQSFAAGEGKVWVMITAKLENPGTEKLKYNTIIDNLYYITEQGEAKYNSQYFDYSQWLNASNYLDPFETREGYYMFNVPESIAPPTDNGLGYANNGKSTSTKGKNFELRFQQNKANPKNIVKIKL